MSGSNRNGVAFAFLAYTVWGLLPLYFKLLKAMSPVEILSYRTIWLLAVMVVILLVKRHDA